MNQFILSPFALDARVPLLDRLARPGWVVNAPTLSGDDTMARMGGVHTALADLVERAVKHGQRPVTIGADCCQSLAVRAGLRRAGLDPIVVWFDAHGDFNTWETSPSGFIAGMSLAMHVGRGDQRLLDGLALTPMPEADVILSDARDLDPAEGVALRGSNVAHVTRVEDLAAHVPGGRPIYVHLDVDVIDAADAPAMHYSVRGGPSLAALLDAAARLHATGRVAAVSVTTWDLARDDDRTTERVCLRVLDALIGER